MSAAARECFSAWVRENERDENYQYWLAVVAEPLTREKDMNINEVFPSDYLKASDLQGRRLKLIISHVEMKTLGTDSKPVLFFEGKDKGLVLNKTKAQTLASSFSPETNGWAGREVCIYPTKVAFQGQMVDSIGLEIVAQEAAAGDVPF